MKKLAAKSPIVFEILLIIAAFVLALLAVEAVYAFVLVLRGNTSGEVTSSQLHQ